MTKIRIGILQVGAGNDMGLHPTTDGQPIVECDSLIAVGDEDDEITINNADGDGRQYRLYAKSATLSHVDISDCFAMGPGIPFYNPHGTDSGNNTNVIFAETTEGVVGYNEAVPKPSNKSIKNKPNI